MQVNCRLPESMGEVIEEAADERMEFQSEIMRRALKHYILTNPHGIAAFDRARRGPREAVAELDESDRGGPYDPTREGER